MGHIFPKTLEKQILWQIISPAQTQTFGLALLESIIEGFGPKVEVMSVAPLLDFPYSRYIVAPGAIWKTTKGIRATMVPFINILGFKHGSRFLGNLLYVFCWSIKNIRKNRVIIMHGVQSCKLWGVIMGQLLLPATTISFITDDLGISLKWEGAVKKKLRHLDVILMKLGLRNVSGVIAMTPWLAENLAPGKVNLIINTILNTTEAEFDDFATDGAEIFRIAYAGGLYSEYGINILIKAFSLTNRPEWRLLIAGRGDGEEYVRMAARDDLRIEYRGFLHDKDLISFYKSADVLINPRPVSTKLASMSFPSKIVEYMRTGKPVVTTPLPSLNDELKEHLIVTNSDKPEELLRCLDAVACWQIDKLKNWHSKTITYLRDNLIPTVQGKKIREFIESLMSN